MSEPAGPPAETRICEFVFPPDTNHLGTLYGGTLMGWMDKAAGIAAFRYAGTPAVVTAAVDKLEFRVPIRQGELVELLAHVESQGRTSMVVRVEVHREDPVTRHPGALHGGHVHDGGPGRGGSPDPGARAGASAAHAGAAAMPPRSPPSPGHPPPRRSAAARASGWSTVSTTTMATQHQPGGDPEREVVAAGERRRRWTPRPRSGRRCATRTGSPARPGRARRRPAPWC